MKTSLQNHLAFFDRQGTEDGTVTIDESRKGLEAVGLSPVAAAVTAVAAHVVLGPMTQRKLTTEIDINNISAGKHPSDSDIYDANGEFDEARFEAKFSRADVNKSGSLSKSELEAMVAAQRDPGMFGWISSKVSAGEWGSLVTLGHDAVDNGEIALSKKAVRDFYTGDFLQHLADRRKR